MTTQGPDPSDYTDPADFAASWQESNELGGQADVEADDSGRITSAGPVITPEDWE